MIQEKYKNIYVNNKVPLEINGVEIGQLEILQNLQGTIVSINIIFNKKNETDLEDR